MEDYEICACGDSAVNIEFEPKITPDINAKVGVLYQKIVSAGINGVVELIPTYRSILIVYNPLIMEYEDLKHKIRECNFGESCIEEKKEDIVSIPVCYGGEYGIDLDYVAAYHNMSPEEVIQIHTEPEYLIYMLGFTPGFPYLGGMNEKIATPRLKVPRTKIEGGSVGIAQNQTGIYPGASPGGWQIIGRTPLKLFDQNRSEPFLLHAGAKIKFVSIGEEEFLQLIRH